MLRWLERCASATTDEATFVPITLTDPPPSALIEKVSPNRLGDGPNAPPYIVRSGRHFYIASCDCAGDTVRRLVCKKIPHLHLTHRSADTTEKS
jgi:hypothetical protein